MTSLDLGHLVMIDDSTGVHSNFSQCVKQRCQHAAALLILHLNTYRLKISHDDVLSWFVTTSMKQLNSKCIGWTLCKKLNVGILMNLKTPSIFFQPVWEKMMKRIRLNGGRWLPEANPEGNSSKRKEQEEKETLFFLFIWHQFRLNKKINPDGIFCPYTHGNIRAHWFWWCCVWIHSFWCCPVKSLQYTAE